MDPSTSTLGLTAAQQVHFDIGTIQSNSNTTFKNGLLKTPSAPFTFGYGGVQNIETFVQDFNTYIETHQSGNPQIKIKLNCGGGQFDSVKYDIYDPSFQNLALKLLGHMDAEEKRALESGRDLPLLTLVRAHNMAIATRADVSWDGKLLMAPDAQKQRELESHRDSLHAYSWPAGKAESHVPGNFFTKISVINTESLKAALSAAQRYTASNVGFVIMAHAENLGGGHQGGLGAQEESEAPKTNSLATLGNYAYFEDGKGCGDGKVVEAKHMGRTRYVKDHQLGTGKNHVCLTRIINSTEKGDFKAIYHAFADFSDKGPYKGLPEDGKYAEITEHDIRAVLRTAKAEGIKVPVVGATGCGIFCHIPEKEAASWKSILEEPEFKGHFAEVIFAILVINPARDQKNLDVFANTFEVQAQ